MRFGYRLLIFWLIVVLVEALPGLKPRGLANLQNQVDPARQKAQAMLERLTPEEKITAEISAAKEGFLSQVSKSEEQLEDHITSNIVGVCPDCGTKMTRILGPKKES
jgi:hypothetical protein